MHKYQKAGIDYTQLDALKRRAQLLARKTADNLKGTGFTDVGFSRGESVFLVEHQKHYIATVLEGLGTKNLVADAMEAATGRSFYEAIGVDTVAMIANDLITLGAKPLVILQYLATGSQAWLANIGRMKSFLRGFKKACDQIGASWGGGETPTLPGIITPDGADLGGCGLGYISPKSRLLSPGKIQDGDAILGIESSGIHANGLSLARELASTLPQAYLTPIGDGRTFGKALLTPTHLYSPLLQKLFAGGIELHYCVNITGHGWRKLMRPSRPFSYDIAVVPPVPPVLSFITDSLGMNAKEAYGTFNMGLGFAFYLPAKELAAAIAVAHECGFKAYALGRIRASRASQINIPSLGVHYKAKDLEVRV